MSFTICCIGCFFECGLLFNMGVKANQKETTSSVFPCFKTRPCRLIKFHLNLRERSELGEFAGGSRGFIPTAVIRGNLLFLGGGVFGRPFLLYHRSGHFPQPCCFLAEGWEIPPVSANGKPRQFPPLARGAGSERALCTAATGKRRVLGKLVV